jgi:hypothetical protein
VFQKRAKPEDAPVRTLCQSPVKQTVELSSVHTCRQLDIPDGLSSRITLDGIHTKLESATIFVPEFRIGDARSCRDEVTPRLADKWKKWDRSQGEDDLTHAYFKTR